MLDFKALRLAAGLATQQAAADTLDVDRRSIGRWERGDIAPPVVVVLALRCMAIIRIDRLAP